LPEKFGIDKRRAHLSTLINSKQITREEALSKLKEPYLEDDILRYDMEYVPKKLGLNQSQFNAILKLPPRKHTDFKTNNFFRNFFSSFKIK
jgi:hypothetical protein